ncbi:MAG: glycosyltransferase [Thermodesulfovibrionales bacterium]
MKSMIKEIIWNFGTKHAALIKRVPLIRALAEGFYCRLKKKRTNEIFSPQYLERFRKSIGSLVPNRQQSGDPFGINIAGFIETESGVGEAVRSNIRAINTLSLPFVLNNLKTGIRHNDRTFGSFSDDNRYQINLIHVNADQVPAFILDRGLGYFRRKYNVGFWVWELPEFPQKWQVLTHYFDEIWTPSTFCSKAISLHCDMPVITVPHSISVDSIRQLNRAHFGLRDDCFIFLFMFDMLSIFERKNPLAVVESFRSAFAVSDNAMLVIKFVNADSNSSAAATIVDATQGLRAKIIDKCLDKDEVHALMSLCDCYVSLHRAEGFGFTLAECMYLSKPVIATAYSGNMDFMDKNNSFPVRYDIVELKEDYGPYKKGSTWAEPDSAHAAELMRFVYENREEAAARGEVAARDIRDNLSPPAVGSIIKKRIEFIAREMKTKYSGSKQLAEVP